MASQFVAKSSAMTVDTEDLDRAIHNLEFEKKQQLRELEKEQQQISVLEASLKEKQDGIRRMEEELTKMDEETKNCHRQFRQNKESKESLKKHATVLNAHLENLEVKIIDRDKKFESENAQHDQTLEHYQSIWRSYEEVYMEQELAQELKKWQLEVLQRKEAIKQGVAQITHLQGCIEEVEAEIEARESPFSTINDFILKIAELKLSTMANSREALDLMCSISSSKKELEELQENQIQIMKKAEEEKQLREAEKKRKEQEKIQREKAQQEELVRRKGQENKSCNQPGMYKFGQFIHRSSDQPKRLSKGSPTAQPPPSPRTPLLIATPARRAARVPARAPSTNSQAPLAKHGAPWVPVHTPNVTPSEASGATVQKVTAPQQPSKYFLNMPPRSPFIPSRSRQGEVQGAVGMEGREHLIPTGRTAMHCPVSSSSLLKTMHQMTIKPTPPTSSALPLVEPGHTSTRPLSTGSSGGSGTHPSPSAPAGVKRSGMHVGPGGDAQPSPNGDPMPEEMDFDASSQPSVISDVGATSDFEMGEAAYPYTPKYSQSSDKTSQPSPASPLDLDAIHSKFPPQSPGSEFSYSFRPMFDETQNQGSGTKDDHMTSDSGSFQENPFFSTMFGMMEKDSSQSNYYTGQKAMLGDGKSNTSKGSAPMPPTTPLPSDPAGSTMSMFGDSPVAAQQDQPHQGAVGFSLNFDDGSPARQREGWDSEPGKGGFCLF
ncbi:uncharacterized protein [Diadema setosum]|uniref:uncharacterized protein isoform X2 n=1 Tax=Diadema setosum TaxID=31175 RepID=UPI003B3AC4F9